MVERLFHVRSKTGKKFIFLLHSHENPSTFIISSAAKSDLFFRVEPDFGPKIRVELGRVDPQGQKTGPIGSGWPQRGFKFGFNPIMYLINPNEPDFGSGCAPRVQIRTLSGQVGRVHLVALIIRMGRNFYDYPGLQQKSKCV
jgi:hypothetical protein